MLLDENAELARRNCELAQSLEKAEVSGGAARTARDSDDSPLS